MRFPYICYGNKLDVKLKKRELLKLKKAANLVLGLTGEIYVDKTELIACTNQYIKTPQKFICISRPRRFGKSMAAYMLAAYYGKDCDSSELFAPYKIAKTEEYVCEYSCTCENASAKFESVFMIGRSSSRDTSSTF